MRTQTFGGLAAALYVACGSAANAQPGSGDGLEWSVIGSPGNAAASPEEFPFLALNGIGPVGAVDHVYRLARTEVAMDLFMEYIRAFIAVYPGTSDDYVLTYDFQCNFCTPQGAERRSAGIPWTHAARMCNWLHNGKALTAAAFETGAYDVHGWDDPRFPTSGNSRHLSGARYWIPTDDEWTKGMFFDTERFGHGQPGYWMYPNGTDTPLVSGPPGAPGAETNTGECMEGCDGIFSVGAYPATQSPWGLLDGSGCMSELVEDGSFEGGLFLVRGSHIASGVNRPWIDRLDWSFSSSVPSDSITGLRLASAVPHCNADFDHDGDSGTDADIEAFFACLNGNCCATCDGPDFDGDGVAGTQLDIEAFFRVLGGNGC